MNMLGHYIGPAPKNSEIGVSVVAETESDGHSREWYDKFLEHCKAHNYRGAYNSAAEDGYDPNVNWKELCES